MYRPHKPKCKHGQNGRKATAEPGERLIRQTGAVLEKRRNCSEEMTGAAAANLANLLFGTNQADEAGSEK